MHLLNNPKYFLILLLTLSFFGVQNLTANTTPRKINKTETKEEKEQQPVKSNEQQQVQQEAQVSDEPNEKENEATDVSKSSFNYLFYLIYKVKFEDVFKFPDRRGPRNSTGITSFNINSLLDRLVQPSL